MLVGETMQSAPYLIALSLETAGGSSGIRRVDHSIGATVDLEPNVGSDRVGDFLPSSLPFSLSSSLPFFLP